MDTLDQQLLALLRTDAKIARFETSSGRRRKHWTYYATGLAAACVALAAWIADWVERNYRPEPRRRQRPRSFQGKEGRLREEGEQ